MGYNGTRSVYVALFFVKPFAVGFLERMFETTMQQDSLMHRYALSCYVVSLHFYKSPNVIRLKEFSKKCESFLFVEVINVISILMNGWTGPTVDTWKCLRLSGWWLAPVLDFGSTKTYIILQMNIYAKGQSTNYLSR